MKKLIIAALFATVAGIGVASAQAPATAPASGINSLFEKMPAAAATKPDCHDINLKAADDKYTLVPVLLDATGIGVAGDTPVFVLDVQIPPASARTDGDKVRSGQECSLGRQNFVWLKVAGRFVDLGGKKYIGTVIPLPTELLPSKPVVRIQLGERRYLPRYDTLEGKTVVYLESRRG